MIKELKYFSKNNWWIYIIFIISLIFVYLSWKWNILEIIILFFANFLWNLFIMIMQKNYTSWKNKVWAIYQISSCLIFSAISLYWLFYFWKSQYLIWQICYLIAAIKSLFFYVFSKNLIFINEYFLWFLNIILLILFLVFWEKYNLNISFESIFMALWFSFVTTWLVITKDRLRYFLNIFWIIFIIIWSIFWLYFWYKNWNIDWISFWYFCLTLTTFLYYLKLLKNYIK